MLPVALNESVAANPGTLNTWLKLNNGYESGYGFKWNATAPLGLIFEGFSQDAKLLKADFDLGKIIFLHVRNNNHYVLMSGYTSDAFLVNDPGYDTLSYPDSEVVKGEAAIHFKDISLISLI